MKFELWTDGSCKNNGNGRTYGGWAWAIYIDDEETPTHYHASSITNATNNQMELLAMITGLKFIEERYPLENFVVFTDSAYIHNCYLQKWYENWEKNGWKNSKKEKVKNRELWENLIPYFKSSRFEFKKIKGHYGIKRNEFVDDLAQSAAEALKKEDIIWEKLS